MKELRAFVAATGLTWGIVIGLLIAPWLFGGCGGAVEPITEQAASEVAGCPWHGSGNLECDFGSLSPCEQVTIRAYLPPEYVLICEPRDGAPLCCNSELRK